MVPLNFQKIIHESNFVFEFNRVTLRYCTFLSTTHVNACFTFLASNLYYTNVIWYNRNWSSYTSFFYIVFKMCKPSKMNKIIECNSSGKEAIFFLSISNVNGQISLSRDCEKSLRYHEGFTRFDKFVYERNSPKFFPLVTGRLTVFLEFQNITDFRNRNDYGGTNYNVNENLKKQRSSAEHR